LGTQTRYGLEGNQIKHLPPSQHSDTWSLSCMTRIRAFVMFVHVNRRWIVGISRSKNWILLGCNNLTPYPSLLHWKHMMLKLPLALNTNHLCSLLITTCTPHWC